MKTTKTSPRNAGSVLMVTLVITGILGLMLASYLTLIGTQNRSVARSQTWNASIPISEAGVEEAITHLNKNCLWSDVTRQPVNWNADGWQTVADGYQQTRWLGENKYVVTIVTTHPHSEMHPAILSEGYVPASLARNMAKTMFAAIGTDETTEPVLVGRKVRVTTSRDGLMTGAMISKDYIDFNGRGVATDSFDSEDPSYSTDGKYDETKAKDNGDVAVNFGVINSLNVGNASISGSIATGPGGSIAIGPGGKVGDAAWMADSSKSGIQPGHSRDDMNVSFPDVEIPFTGGYSTPTGRRVTNEVIIAASITNTSSGYPSGSGTVYTNTTTVTTTSYPSSGTYLGSVNTNTNYTVTPALPSSGTYQGILTTNSTSVTSTDTPSDGTYIGTVMTNAPTYTTTAYPTDPYGAVTTNTTWISNSRDYPDAGTYVGTVITTYTPTRYAYSRIDNYTYKKITGYTWEEITGYAYHKITGYTVARITGYNLVSSTYTTNYVAKDYDFVLDSGNYKISNLTGDVLVLGEAVLYVTDSLNVNQVEIETTARLKLYMGGSGFSISGNKFINKSGNADNLWYFGLPTNTEISVNGNGGFCGVIYAPQAHFQLNGGGTDTWDFIGSSLTKSTKMNGHFEFHYDEALARKGASRGYVINSWDEVGLDETH